MSPLDGPASDAVAGGAADARGAASLAIVRRYLAAIEARVPEDEVAAFFHEQVIQEEFPNRLVPNGARRDLAALRFASARGRQVIGAERYQIQHALAVGDRVALEVIWTGQLAIPLGSLPAGAEMRAHFAVFIELREGKIIAQRNYDCLDPW